MPSPKTSILINDSEKLIQELMDFGDYRIGYLNLKKKESQGLNEDVLFFSGVEQKFIMGVSDGAGGHPKGQMAAKTVSEEIIKIFDSEKFEPIEAIEKVNDKVIDLKVGAKCTFAFATIENHFFRCHSVGDSEIVYWNSNGNEVFSNVPHSSVGYQIKAGSLDQEESLDDPERHYVMNLMGDESVRIDSSSKISMKKGHTVLIGTDGIFDNISHGALKEIVAKGNFEKSFEDISNLCSTQDESTWKKDDDIAFLLIRKIKAE